MRDLWSAEWGKNGTFFLRLIALLFVSFFLLASFFPDSWWGIHHIAFLPTLAQIPLFVLAVGLILFPKILNEIRGISNLLFNKKGNIRLLTIVLTAAIFVFLFFSFPIFLDEYGDAYRFQTRLKNVLTDLPDEFYDDAFGIQISPGEVRKSVLFFIGYLSYTLQASYAQVFKWIGIISGVGFIAVWLLFLRNYLKSSKWQFVLGVVGILAPFTQVFYGHTEVYSLVFFLFSSWLIGLALFFKNRNTSLLLFLLLSLLLCIKIHPMGWLLVAGWIVGVVHYLNSRNSTPSKNIDLSKVAFGITALTFLGGIILYLVILKDFKDERFLEGVTDMERLFLPLISPPPPLDTYNLLSLNHIWDYFNAILHWSVPAIFILVGLIVTQKKNIDWKQPALVAFLTIFILMAALLFMLNPLVSMPMDWDLFSFPALVLLILATLIIAQVEDFSLPPIFVSASLALVLIAAPFFIVNSNVKMLSYRLESVGIHMFKTYYLHANRVLFSAMNLLEYGDLNMYMERKNQMEEELRPYTCVGNDPAYAFLLKDDGHRYLTMTKEFHKAQEKFEMAALYHPEDEGIRALLAEAKLFSEAGNVQGRPERYNKMRSNGLILLREYKDYKRAKQYFTNASKVFPDSSALVMYLMETCFMLKNVDGAYFHALDLVNRSYPDKTRALRIAIHCALEAHRFVEALEHCEEYRKLNPDDAVINTSYARLKAHDRPEQLRLLFSSK